MENCKHFINPFYCKTKSNKRSSINDLKFLKGGSQVFCDDSTKAMVIKGVTMGGGWGQKV